MGERIKEARKRDEIEKKYMDQMKKYQVNVKEMQDHHKFEMEKMEAQVEEIHGREKMEVREELFGEQEKYNTLNNKYLEVQQQIELSKIQQETLTTQLQNMPDHEELEELKHVKADCDILKA